MLPGGCEEVDMWDIIGLGPPGGRGPGGMPFPAKPGPTGSGGLGPAQVAVKIMRQRRRHTSTLGTVLLYRGPRETMNRVVATLNQS